jgi:hypothetical protein
MEEQCWIPRTHSLTQNKSHRQDPMPKIPRQSHECSENRKCMPNPLTVPGREEKVFGNKRKRGQMKQTFDLGVQVSKQERSVIRIIIGEIECREISVPS